MRTGGSLFHGGQCSRPAVYLCVCGMRKISLPRNVRKMQIRARGSKVAGVKAFTAGIFRKTDGISTRWPVSLFAVFFSLRAPRSYRIVIEFLSNFYRATFRNGSIIYAKGLSRLLNSNFFFLHFDLINRSGVNCEKNVVISTVVYILYS